MAFTYDLTTDVGKVRALIPDRNVANYFFEDEEITAFLAMEGAVKPATALSLETLASNEAYVQKVIKLLDLTTNGAQTSAALLARADRLRQQATDEGAVGLDYAENPQDVFSLREKLLKDSIRGL